VLKDARLVVDRRDGNRRIYQLDPDGSARFQTTGRPSCRSPTWWSVGRVSPRAPDRTRVELEHRNLERHGEGWEGDARRGRLAQRPLCLQRFAERLKR
jgi:DNA-binding transcriptional ArsR family regulator